MSNLNQTLVCGAAALLAGMTCIGGSIAHAAEAPRARAVSYADLDLSRDAGKATLFSRVRVAASAVCRNGGQTAAEVAAEKRCIANAVDAAMTKAASLS